MHNRELISVFMRTGLAVCARRPPTRISREIVESLLLVRSAPCVVEWKNAFRDESTPPCAQADSCSIATIKHVTVTCPITSDKCAGTILLEGEKYSYSPLFT